MKTHCAQVAPECDACGRRAAGECAGWAAGLHACSRAPRPAPLLPRVSPPPRAPPLSRAPQAPRAPHGPGECSSNRDTTKGSRGLYL